MAKAEKNKQSVEPHTSWKVIVAYLIIIILCCVMFHYIIELRHSIDNQRHNINSRNVTFEWVSHFTQKVHKAQNTSNRIAFSNQPQLIHQFTQQCETLNAIADSIANTEIPEQDKLRIKEITNLIERKGKVSYALSKQFNDFDPMADFDRTLNNYQPTEHESSTYVTTAIKDTIVHQQKRLNFWQRLGNVFNPIKDSIVQVSTIKHDTLVQHQSDSLPILHDLRTLSNKAKDEYQNKIKEYERQVSRLIADDNQLSEKIATLLLQLNQEVLDSTLDEIAQSESIIKENTRRSTWIGAATLVLIIFFIILIISDVKKISRMRKTAEDAKKRTEEVLESRHKLLLSVSHDIKTPLTSILGNTELMDKSVNGKEIKSIEQSADHILNLLTDLLEFSCLEQGKLKVENTSFDILSLCREITAMFEPIARQKNLQLHLSTNLTEGRNIITDRLKIKQIICNLISNGLKYTLEGSVDLVAKIEEERLLIDISDTGLGIPQDKIDEVFKPFTRIDTYNQFAEGSGYGLSVVKGLVDLLQGEIQLESEVGRGSHFSVVIPIEISQDKPKETHTLPQHHSSPLNILIIDDDPALLSVVVGLLEKLGHVGIPCSSKNDVDDALRQAETYDYILTDREMGAVSGNEILHLFKVNGTNKPVILMTARMEYNDQKAKEEGFDGFLHKPFNMKDLETLFGRNAEIETDNIETPFKEIFPVFCAMMDNDAAAIRSVLEVFASSTANDLLTLNTYIDTDDFASAQALCHKMLPMFTQLEQDTTFLSKMNELRGQGDAAEVYPQWANDATTFMAQADKLLDNIDRLMGG